MWRAVALASGHFAHAEGAAVDHLGAEVPVEAIGAVDVEAAVRAADHVDEARVEGRVLLDARPVVLSPPRNAHRELRVERKQALGGDDAPSRLARRGGFEGSALLLEKHSR